MDQSGTIDKSELLKLMNDIASTVYHARDAITEDDINQLMSKLDENNDRQLQYNEFLLLIESIPLQLDSELKGAETQEANVHKRTTRLEASNIRATMNVILKFFGATPTNNFIKDLEQLSSFEDSYFCNQLAKHFFNHYDKNGNGKIDRTEWKRLGKDIEAVVGRERFRPGKFMKLFPVDREGEITLAEFQIIFQRLNMV